MSSHADSRAGHGQDRNQDSGWRLVHCWSPDLWCWTAQRSCWFHPGPTHPDYGLSGMAATSETAHQTSEHQAGVQLTRSCSGERNHQTKLYWHFLEKKNRKINLGTVFIMPNISAGINHTGWLNCDSDWHNPSLLFVNNVHLETSLNRFWHITDGLHYWGL